VCIFIRYSYVLRYLKEAYGFECNVEITPDPDLDAARGFSRHTVFLDSAGLFDDQ
jgi:hypothetical protein